MEDEILDKLKVIKTIEGPVNSIILKPNKNLYEKLGRNGPIIMLLGDYHDVRKANRCETCIISDGCYSLYKKSSLITYLDTIVTAHTLAVPTFTFVKVMSMLSHKGFLFQVNNEKTQYISSLL